MVNAIGAGNTYDSYTLSKVKQVESAASAGKGQATQAVQSSAPVQPTPNRDTVQLSAEARALSSAATAQTNAAQTKPAAQEAATAQATAAVPQTESAGAQAAQQSAQMQAKQSVAAVSNSSSSESTEADDTDTDLSGLTEQQISRLVSQGTVTSAQAATELAKRTEAKGQAAPAAATTQVAAIMAQSNSARTGLILNAVA